MSQHKEKDTIAVHLVMKQSLKDVLLEVIILFTDYKTLILVFLPTTLLELIQLNNSKVTLQF